MRTAILVAATVALALSAYAGAYEETVKFGDEKWTDMKVEFDEINAVAYLSSVYTGQVKKAKVRFVDHTNYDTDYKNLTVTTIEGDSKEMSVEGSLVGMFQFVDIYPETDKCKFELSFEATDDVKGRIGHGLLKVEDLVPVGGEVKNMGSVVSTKDAKDPGYIDYMDQSDIGWTVSYDKDTGIITINGSAEAYIDFDSGCFDIGVVIVR